MEKATTRLTEIIEGQLTVYETLLRLTKEETRAVTDHRVEDVLSLVSQKEVLVNRLQILERERMDCAQKVALHLGLDTPAPALKAIGKALGPELGRTFEAAGKALSKAIQELDDANRHNKGLLNHVLELVKGSIGLLSGNPTGRTVYQPSGQVAKNEAGGRFVSGQV